MPQTGLSRRKRRDQVPGFSPLNLFAASEVGLWYDPSDLTPEKLAWVAANPGFTSAQFLAAFPNHTLFQDSAGTTPVTALGQPVGKILDKSGRGNHATQATSAARPTLQARANLLTYSEQFDNAAWTKGNITVTQNAAVAPDGATTADKLVETATTSTHLAERDVTVVSGATYTASVYMKKAERTFGRLRLGTATGGGTQVGSVTADLTTGTIAIGSTPAGTSYSVEPVGNDWVKLTVTAAASGTTLNIICQIMLDATTNNYAGDITKGILIWGADLRLGTSAGTYQRVVTATDYADVGLPRSLTFDGTDDSLVTPSVNFTATDKMTVCAGVFKQNDTASIVAELSSSIATNAGSWYALTGNDSGYNSYSATSRGTSGASASLASGISGFPAPESAVLTMLSDIAGDLVRVRRNGVIGTDATGDQGTGNYGNYPLFIGSRNQASVRFNGRIHQLIVRGAATDTATIQQTERFVATKTGVTL